MKLTRQVAEGYGAAPRPVDQVIRDLVADRERKLPILVWVCSPDDYRENQELEREVFDDEKVAIALRKFVCFQASIGDLPDGKLARDLDAIAPAIFLYHADGKPFEQLDGGRSSARSRLYRALGKLWKDTFETRLRDFTRKMTSLLGKLERVERKLIAVEIKRDRAGGNPARERACDREEEKLTKEEDELLEEQKELVAGVVPKTG